MAPLPPLTLAQPVDPSADCCHWIVPVWPLTLTVVVLPVQIVLEAAVAVPPTDIGSTTIVLTAEKTDAHAPLFTSALYSHVPADDGVSLYVVFVFAILDQAPAFTRFCHCTILPVCPLNVIVPVAVP